MTWLVLWTIVFQANYTACPQYCIEYSLAALGKCAREAREKYPTDDKKFNDMFTTCTDKLKEEPMYKRCQKVCNK